MNDDTVIIIPTKGRQNYLNRVASYYDSFDMHTYICDAYQTKYEVDAYEKVHYQWAPQKGFFEELLDIVNTTNALYYLLAPDDDFVKFETLVKCQSAMRHDNRIAMCSGRQLFFLDNFDGRFTYFKSHNLICESANHYIKKENACSFERNYQNIHWSLFRRDCLVDALTKLDEAKFNYACFAEFIFGIEGILHGGIYFDNDYLNYRELSSTPHWGSVAPSIDFRNLLFSKELHEDIRKLKKVYGSDYSFVRKCLISYIIFHSSLLGRIITKIRSGSEIKYDDYEMKSRITAAISKMG